MVNDKTKCAWCLGEYISERTELRNFLVQHVSCEKLTRYIELEKLIVEFSKSNISHGICQKHKVAFLETIKNHKQTQ